MTGTELITKLNMVTGTESSNEFLLEVKKVYAGNFDMYFKHVKTYADQNGLTIDEYIVRNNMFEKLYALRDLISNNREKILIGDMAWDLVGDIQIINYGLETIPDILQHKTEFLQANKHVAQQSYKDFPAKHGYDFNGDSQTYLVDNVTEMYRLLKNSKPMFKN